MRFFLDTEFIERGPNFPVTLISIGIVDERGGEFYAVSSDFREENCSDWVKANVLPHIAGEKRLALRDIAILVREWVDLQCEDGSKPEFWGYYCDYDWVVFCQMFGTMMDLPRGWPKYCRDIKQLRDDLGTPALPKQAGNEHNALADARWNKLAYSQLKAKPNAAWFAREDKPEAPNSPCMRYGKGEAVGWVAVSDGMPPDELIVNVYQLQNWAKHTKEGWMAVDRCGNVTPLSWEPEFWCYNPLPSPPQEGKDNPKTEAWAPPL